MRVKGIGTGTWACSEQYYVSTRCIWETLELFRGGRGGALTKMVKLMLKVLDRPRRSTG